MKTFDAHVHAMCDGWDVKTLKSELQAGEVSGAALISLPPEASPFPEETKIKAAADRLEMLMRCCAGPQDGSNGATLFPFFWIDPFEDDALEQAESASRAGVSGFKIIFSREYPSHPQAMSLFRKIAELRKPLLFHSGILYDNAVSGKFNRPLEFECLMDVSNLKFALAHMSWPWTDECLALFGKFQFLAGCRPGVSQMFIDMAPGTPKIYRRDVLTKLFTGGYKVEDRLLFGSDNIASCYDVKHMDGWRKMDMEIMKENGVGQEAVEKYFAGNFLAFIGR